MTCLQTETYCESFAVKTKSQPQRATWAKTTREIVQRSRLKEKKPHALAQIHGAAAESHALKHSYLLSAVPQE